jgi:hypothetical protein
MLARSRSVTRRAKCAANRVERGRRKPVRHEVLLHDDVDRRLLREEGRVAEDLPLLEHLERAPVALQAHRALADDVQVSERLPAGSREHGPGRMERDVERGDRPLEGGVRQLRERRDGAEPGGGIDRGHGALSPADPP